MKLFPYIFQSKKAFKKHIIRRLSPRYKAIIANVFNLAINLIGVSVPKRLRLFQVHCNRNLLSPRLSIASSGYGCSLLLAKWAESTLFQHLSNQLNENNISNRSYIVDLTSYMTKEQINSIETIISSESILRHAKKWLRSKPYLSIVQIYANVPNQFSSNLEGSKLWHQDSNVLTRAEYYVNLSNVESKNGPLFIHKPSTINWFSFPRESSGTKWEDINRFNDQDLQAYDTSFKSNTDSNIGSIGTVTFMDSGLHFHRGGAIETGKRIVLRFGFDNNIFVAERTLRKYVGKERSIVLYKDIYNSNINHPLFSLYSRYRYFLHVLFLKFTKGFKSV